MASGLHGHSTPYGTPGAPASVTAFAFSRAEESRSGERPVAGLAARGVIRPETAEAVQDAVGSHNVIAHPYLDLDPALVYEGLGKTEALKHFAADVWAWLGE